MSFFQYEADPQVWFDMYTSMHALMLVLVLLLFTVLIIAAKHLHKQNKTSNIQKGLAYFLIALLLGQIVVDASGGVLYLPFHLCSISYLLTIVLLLSDSYKTFQFLFFTGIIGGIVTFFIPELDHAGWNRFRFYEFIIAHTMIIFVPLYYLVVRSFSITKTSLLHAILITNILALIMIPINLFLSKFNIVEDANYMFVMRPPSDVESIFGAAPWHLLSFELVLIVTYVLLYLITNIYQKRTAHE